MTLQKLVETCKSKTCGARPNKEQDIAVTLAGKNFKQHLAEVKRYNQGRA